MALADQKLEGLRGSSVITNAKRNTAPVLEGIILKLGREMIFNVLHFYGMGMYIGIEAVFTIESYLNLMSE